MTVSDSLIDNCEAETRIDHQVDDDDKRVSPNSIRTIDGLDSSSSSDGGSSDSSQSNNKSRKWSRSPSDDRRGNFKKPTSQRSDNNRDTSSRHGNNGERKQSRNYLSDDGQQRNRASNQNALIQTTGIRIKIETSLVIILITKIYNTITIVGKNGMYTNRVQNTNKKFVRQKTTYKSSDPGIQKNLCNPPPSPPPLTPRTNICTLHKHYTNSNSDLIFTILVQSSGKRRHGCENFIWKSVHCLVA